MLPRHAVRRTLAGPQAGRLPRRAGHGSCWEIVVADATDSHETVVAGPYPRDVWDDHFIANWAPDGSNLIFMADQKIWRVNADGSNLHVVFTPPDDGTGLTRLTSDTKNSGSLNPSYSPDRSRIIFTHFPSTGGADLFTMNPDGSGVTQLTRTAAVELFPQWAAG